MTYSNIAKNIWLPLVMLALFLTAVIFRPLLPVDETRYMTVAWEMFLNHGWLKPLTINFEPYHHKPPVLFWLINLSWSIFGISRWAGLLPVILTSMSCIYLTGYLSKLLFPDMPDRRRIWLIMIGSLPFMIYATLVMFDFMLCCFVLLSLISLVHFKIKRQMRYALAMGLFLGLGVLTKGPVAYLYIIPVALLAPFWVKDFSRSGQWYGAIFTAVLISIIPVLFWLVPVLMASDNNFAFWLVWNQTAGRVTGNFSASHERPIWFYLPLLPILFMPWMFFPTFWKNIPSLKAASNNHEGLRFLLFWVIPVFIAFSCISGKQPHYMVPLLPGIVLFIAYRLRDVQTARLAKVFAAVFVFFIGGQIIASHTIFERYTFEPVAEIIQTQPKRPLAFVHNYHGELGFTARRDTPVVERTITQLDQWFDEHPDGWAVIRYEDGQPDIKKYKMILSHPYRGKNLGLFEK